jgi:hypothetical protein
MALMPDDLSRLELVRLNGDTIDIVTLEEEPERCDDDGCTFEHQMRSFSLGRSVDASPENFRRLAEHFRALSEGR